MNHVHEAFSLDSAKDFWEKWNREHGEDMTCVHDYVIEALE